ncbi:hypothetical protein DNK47_03235 [Mycoplasma wenyonii]|uniref:Uncharacterized protein n=1 Tax=Mycoplasma wenyonii TaxID=65123 RepID=A0A328PI82_9MOLU|nr:hypothetical protein [Mycoplasma wenyonii]RAO94773.1 hypothetical protein DNK47_03235 [Mycoplasma wenyonii]
MSLLLTALKGLVCLTPVVAIPVAITLPKDSTQATGTYSRRGGRNGPCQLVISNSDESVSVIVCPITKKPANNKTSFYLYKKEESTPFSEIEKWDFNKEHYTLKVTKTENQTTETLNFSSDQGWSDLNQKVLKNVCTIEWKDNGLSPNKKMQCKEQGFDKYWLLSGWRGTFPEHLKS